MERYTNNISSYFSSLFRTHEGDTHANTHTHTHANAHTEAHANTEANTHANAEAKTHKRLEEQVGTLEAQNKQLKDDLRVSVAKEHTNSPSPLSPLSPPPSGSITVVFSDVQGSTTQWELHPNVMASALILHNKIIRGLLEQYQGYEVKTQGDSFMVAFQDPHNAIRWCLSVQAALFSAPWNLQLMEHPDSAEEFSLEGILQKRGLRVRMGIHIGTPDSIITDPVTNRTDYFGKMINKASRISGLASGGQIVVSEIVRRMLLPITKELSVRIQHLGSFKLKGIERKEEIYEVIPC